ncbi:MAG: hypothetical protein IJZ36_04900 [Bacilli bacterium]|nr:hypothetical protein [Bacilli bacterium]
MKDLKALQKELESYNNKDLSIIIEGSLKLSLTIHNAQCMVTKKVLLVGNSDLTNEEIEITVDEINCIEINSEIHLEMNGNYDIYIST